MRPVAIDPTLTASDPRTELESWRAAGTENYYDAAPDLALSLHARLGADEVAALEPRLRAFGKIVATVVDPSVRSLEMHGPSLSTADALGHECARVEFHPNYERAGRAIWASGIAATPAFEQAALIYLLAHAGEGGHTCPAVCTAGLIRALRRHGSQELQEKFLPPLLDTDYDRCQRGAQFLTEVQGGSDVGANRVEAVQDGEVWRLYGEKWFCSVADADQFLVTARPRGAPTGTRGIGCFLVPRLLWDGSINGFRLRRLKDKLGTRALATGEIEFADAIGYAIGSLEEGFHIAAGVVLNTSRWLNALGSAGLMRRAYLEASSFARFRSAFGRRVGDFPLVRESLAVMKVEEQATLESTLELTALVERIDTGRAREEDVIWHRILVNANKFATSVAASVCVRRAIEVLGGNGTIEDFSVLPRLYRDAIVFESWEGTHNVLCAQVLRDLARLDAVDLVLTRIRELLPSDGGDASAVASALDALHGQLGESMANGGLHARRRVQRLVHALQAACLLAHGKDPAAALIVRRHLLPGYDPEADPRYSGMLDEVLGDDLAGDRA